MEQQTSLRIDGKKNQKSEIYLLKQLKNKQREIKGTL